MSVSPVRTRPPFSQSIPPVGPCRTSSATPYAQTPAAVHVSRYPAAKSHEEREVRPPAVREYSATVGATDGNIMAVIITTQTPRNQPSVPKAVHGPASMPLI